MRRSSLATAAILTITAIWGSTFFIIKDAVALMHPADYLAVRFTIAAVLASLLLLPRLRRLTPRAWCAGLGLGVLYGAAQLAQTVGLQHTSASISGFITGTYVILTPVLLVLLTRTRLAPRTWLAAAVATAGLALLTVTPSQGTLTAGSGEALTLLGALIYAAHIIVLDRVTTEVDALALTAVQLIGVALTCLAAGAPGGYPVPAGADGRAAWTAILYTALIAGIGTMLLQTWAQKHVSPTRTSLLMTFEPVFAAAFAMTLGGEAPALRVLVGGAVIIIATLLGMAAPRHQPTQDDHWHARKETDFIAT